MSKIGRTIVFILMLAGLLAWGTTTIAKAPATVTGAEITVVPDSHIVTDVRTMPRENLTRAE